MVLNHADTPMPDPALQGAARGSGEHASAPGEGATSRNDLARVRRIWTGRGFVLRAALAGMLLSTLVAFLIPSRFDSTTRLMPPEQMNSGMAMIEAIAGGRGNSDLSSGLSSGLGGIAGDLLGLKSSGGLFIGILESRTIQDDIIAKFGLQRMYREKYLEDARNRLRMNTDISEDRKSGMISIQVTDRDPRRAASIAEEYVAELNQVVNLLNTSSARRERVFLEERLGQVRLDLAAAEKGFSEFASKNAAIDIEAQGKVMLGSAAELEGQMIAGKTELEALKQIYSDNNVRVRATRAKVDELQRQLQKLDGNGQDGVAGAIDGQQDPYPPIRELPLLGVSYADLYRNTKIQETIFETLTQAYELAKVEEAKETPSVKIIDPPNVPEKRSFPHRMQIIVVGTCVFFAGGVVWLLGVAAWGDIEPRDPRKMFAREVFETMVSRPFGSLRGDGALGMANRIRISLRKRTAASAR
jgi:capsule polysaccharide export protein KpsE/RkpR